MKKLLLIISFSLCFLSSCKEKTKDNINIYIDKNLSLLMNEIVKIYEDKNEDIKINISYERPKNFNNLDIVITSEASIFIPIIEVEEETAEDSKESKIKENFEETQKDYSDEFETAFFAKDNLIIIGRKRLNDLNELLYTSIAVPNYDNVVGKFFIDELSNVVLFKEISKKIEYTDDSISAMQSVDLYEVDFAIINSMLLNFIKNSEVCYVFNITDEEGNKKDKEIVYNRYIKKESSEEIKNFYEFLVDEKVQKIIDRNKNKI